MKAILIQPDKSLIWSEVPDPVPEKDEVLIGIAYAALNRADLMQREGNYPPPPGCPEWMGLEVSGRIAAMGPEAAEKSPFRIGDEVCALLGGGGYAEYVCVKYDMLMPVPKGSTLAEAAAMPEAFCTAYLNLFIEGKAKAGDTVLMQAGASGLASVVIPMAKAFGMRVITTVRRSELAERIRCLGADLIVDTSKERLADVLKAQKKAGTPVDVAIDCVGGEELGNCLPYLSHGARWIVIASLAGRYTQVDLNRLFVHNVRLIGSTLRSRTPGFKAELISMLVRDVYPLIEAGKVKPTIYKIFPIAEAEQAQTLMAGGTHNGKIVLAVPHC